MIILKKKRVLLTAFIFLLVILLISYNSLSRVSFNATNDTNHSTGTNYLSLKEILNLYVNQNKVIPNALIRQIKGAFAENSPNSIATGSIYTKKLISGFKHNYNKISYSIDNIHSNKEQSKFDRPDSDSVLILTLVGDKESYGSAERNFRTYIKTIRTIIDDQNVRASLGILCNNEDEFRRIQEYLDLSSNQNSLTNTIHHIDLLYAPFLEERASSTSDLSISLDRQNRHSDLVQRRRRRLLAKLRNFLIMNTLSTEEHILFIDADIIRFKNAKKFLKTLIMSNKDIIVPRIDIKGMKDYDKNSWRGERTKPDKSQLKKMDNKELSGLNYVPKDKPGKIYHFEDYLNNKNNEYELNRNNLNYVVPLDSVGGAVLLMKSIIFQQGIIFPTSFIVGTTWDRSEGYDGIETEGICYLAQALNYTCWGMPNLYAMHART